MESPTKIQAAHGKALGFDDDEIKRFVSAAATREGEGRSWDGLFEKNAAHLILPLKADADSQEGLTGRVQRILKAYNARVPAGGETLRYDPVHPKRLQRMQNGKPSNQTLKLTPFLRKLDDAEALLLAQDLQVEWGKKTAVDAAPEAEAKPVAFSALQNTMPLAADAFAPDNLRVVLSRDPIDIAGMSTGRRWTSCTGKRDAGGLEGANYHTIKGEIEAGTLVAYLVHEDDTALRYPLMRVLLKPFHSSDNTRTLLVPNHVYGSDMQGNSLMKDRLLETVRDFVSHGVNQGAQGRFAMDKRVYSDGQETTLTMGDALQGDALAKAIAGGVYGKIQEYLTEIEAAHRRGHFGVQALYTRKLRDLYAKPEVAATAYLRNLAAMNIGQSLPKPSDVIAAMHSDTVKQELARHEILANLYLLGAEGWGAFMQSTHPQLRSISLTDMNMGNIGAAALAKNTTLTALNVSWNKIGAAGAKALAGNTTLTSLDISSNIIGAAGAEALAENTTLTSLDISNNNIGAAGAVALAKNSMLTSLDIGWNNIGDAGAIALAGNTTLTSLNFFYSDIGDEGAEALAKNTTLTSLDVSSNNIGAAGAKALQEGLKHNKNLLYFKSTNAIDLSQHLEQNRTAALALIDALKQDEPITPDAKQEISQRANAMRQLIKEDRTLDPAEKDTLLARIQRITSTWASKVQERRPANCSIRQP